MGIIKMKLLLTVLIAIYRAYYFSTAIYRKLISSKGALKFILAPLSFVMVFITYFIIYIFLIAALISLPVGLLFIFSFYYTVSENFPVIGWLFMIIILYCYYKSAIYLENILKKLHFASDALSNR